ncbi:hypothetical protein AB0904_05225 [Streptomyces sp. NPDC006684]|uniref:hypothetical protein n=2 Tax=Streptomyces TaxID=1883 RepID=UPI003451FCA2
MSLLRGGRAGGAPGAERVAVVDEAPERGEDERVRHDDERGTRRDDLPVGRTGPGSGRGTSEIVPRSALGM